MSEPKKPRRKRKPYSPRLAHQITDLYQSGFSLNDISNMPKMPANSTIMGWAKARPEFRAMLDGARISRGLLFEERAIAVGTSEPSKDDVPGARLAFDAYKWGAEVSDPSRYGKKLTHEGNADKPIAFRVVTGVPAPLPHQLPPELGADGRVIPAVIEAESRPVDDSTSPEAE